MLLLELRELLEKVADVDVVRRVRPPLAQREAVRHRRRPEVGGERGAVGLGENAVRRAVDRARGGERRQVGRAGEVGGHRVGGGDLREELVGGGGVDEGHLIFGERRQTTPVKWTPL